MVTIETWHGSLWTSNLLTYHVLQGQIITFLRTSWEFVLKPMRIHANRFPHCQHITIVKDLLAITHESTQCSTLYKATKNMLVIMWECVFRLRMEYFLLSSNISPLYDRNCHGQHPTAWPRMKQEIAFFDCNLENDILDIQRLGLRIHE